ncbi:Ulp1 family isopeptidase [Mesorhizobium amorphae]|uniref:Ulp1 family isopeptidase n=1 Tax=Mesorhizobium amorphae TaxID=71433 RepID=UPI0024E18762|nr:Ulp1 family isopeptidase [Mesorhizobium amorphae]
MNGANHWSLLLIDRRARERPVAYHYDSFSPLHHTIATEFAERLGASSLQPMGMAQQRNSFDCGVFLLDATRELARRLAQEPRPRIKCCCRVREWLPSQSLSTGRPTPSHWGREKAATPS